MAGAGFLILFNSELAVVLAGSLFVGAIAIAGGSAAIVLALRQRIGAALITVACALIAVNWIFVLKGCSQHTSRRQDLPRFSGARDARRHHRHLQRRATEPRLLPPSTHRRVLRSRPCHELLRTGRPLFLMASRDDYERAIKPAEPVPLAACARNQPST